MKKILLAIILASITGCLPVTTAPNHVVVDGVPESRRLAKEFNQGAIDCIKAGELDNAREFLSSAIESDDKFGPAYNTLGIYHLSTSPRNLEKAAQAFHTASSLMEDNSAPLFHLGNTWEFKGAWKKAIAEYDKVLMRKPDHYPSYSCKARALVKLGTCSQTMVQMLKRVIKIDPRKSWQQWAELELIRIKAKIQSKRAEL